MAKTYLPDIKRRVINRENQNYGIINNDADNAYKQRVIELIAASPTAKDCWDKRTDFYHGQGFEDKEFAKAVINDRGLTVAKLLRSTARDKAVLRCFGIHINYNANYKICSVNFVKDEDVRMGQTKGIFNNTYKIYKDWGRKTGTNILTQRICILPKFDPDPEVIKQQVIDAGGWDKYKGQLYYFNPEVDDYSLATCDSVLEDIETEADLKIFANRSVTTGFMPSSIIFMKARREVEDSNPEAEESDDYEVPSQLSKDLATFQGAENGLKTMVIEYEDEDQKPDVHSFEIKSVDKLFEVTTETVENRIIKGWSMPRELSNTLKVSGLSNGSEKKEAIIQFNDDTKGDRDELSEAFKEIFSLWWQPINPSGNYDIVPTPAKVVEDSLGKTSGANINELLLSSLPKQVKLKTLVYVYQMSEDEASELVAALPESQPINTTNDVN